MSNTERKLNPTEAREKFFTIDQSIKNLEEQVRKLNSVLANELPLIRETMAEFSRISKEPHERQPQIEKKKIARKVPNTGIDEENSDVVTVVKSLERAKIENSNLKYLLEQADEKSHKKLKKMKHADALLTKLITDIRENEEKRTEDVRAIANFMGTVLSALTEIKGHIELVHGTKEIYGTDIPG
jgi:chromosome segregation ATPase